MLAKERQKESIFRKTIFYQLYEWLLFACVLFVIPLVDSLREERNRSDS
jgi:hypothetical protein